MNHLKVCFVGVGSIGKRHIKNLHSICFEKRIALTIDALRSSYGQLEKEIASKIHQTYTEESTLPNDYDIIFLTNPTCLHIDMLLRLHNKTKHFFIEKPLTSYDCLDKVFTIPYRKDSVYYVACPLRYHKVIQFLKNESELGHVMAVRCISSSYLPDWRPGTDYRKTYSADRAMGGGVSLDLIHEWDYIRYLFGDPDTIFYTSGRKSALDLNCEDFAIYVADYPDKIIELHLDYFGRETVREIMLLTEEDTIIGDLVHNRIRWLKQQKEICYDEVRDDMQKRELLHFLDIIEGKTACDNDVAFARQTILFTKGKMK